MKRPLRIAVADDELDIRAYFQRILPRLGHCVVAVAENGRELIEQCRAVHPDLVITDVKMPDMDGIDAVEAICREQPTAIILMSAHVNSEPKTWAHADRLMGFLTKPIKQADLQPMIDLAAGYVA
jgi:response regulator NasT